MSYSILGIDQSLSRTERFELVHAMMLELMEALNPDYLRVLGYKRLSKEGGGSFRSIQGGNSAGPTRNILCARFTSVPSLYTQVAPVQIPRRGTTHIAGPSTAPLMLAGTL